MLTSAFDASGDKASPVVAVAGFVSNERDWRTFSEQWSKRLAVDGIEFFRAVDAASFQGPFKHWNDRPDRDDLRRALFKDLMGILKSNVYHRFGSVVINKSFDKMSEQVRKRFRLCAYTLAGITCEKQVRKYILEEWRNSNPQMPVKIVFEHGDEGFGDLYYWLSSAPGAIPPSRAYKKDTVQDDGLTIYGFVPLQAADWLAYELGLLVRHLENGRITNSSNIRWPMREFMRVLGDAGTYYADDIQEAERKLSSIKNDPNWQKNVELIKFVERFPE